MLLFPGTLFKYLDNCITPCGKRLLRSWICHPLKDVEEINDRLNVVEALIMRSEILLIVAQYLRKIPDLERLLGKVKSMVYSQAILMLPLVGKKTLKQRVRMLFLYIRGTISMKFLHSVTPNFVADLYLSLPPLFCHF